MQHEPEQDLNDIEPLLSTLHLDGRLIFDGNLESPWGIAFPEDARPTLHIAKKGNITVGTDSGDIVVAESNLLMLRQLPVRWIADNANSDRQSAESLPASGCLALTESEKQTAFTHRVICGALSTVPSYQHPLLTVLPVQTVMPLGEPGTLLADTVELLDQCLQQSPQSLLMTGRLIETLFVQVLIALWQGKPSSTAANAIDPRLIRALTVLHNDPADPWTLDRLAQAAGASRATLIRLFSKHLGTSFAQYLLNFRMERAQKMLRSSHLSVEQVSLQSGYSTRESFSRAYRQHFNLSPGDDRALQ